jgi:hypothetical protein
MAQVPSTREQPESHHPLILFERDPANRLEVADDLRARHPLIRSTKRALAEAKKGARATEPRLDISVDASSLARVFRILQALLAGLESRGFRVTTTSDGTTEVELLGERVRFGVVERKRRVAHQLTAQEKRRQERSDLHYAPRWDYVPTGEPILWVGHKHYGGRQFKDGKRRRLEERLNDVIEAFVQEALADQTRRAEQERAAREREEARRRWQQAERVRREEHGRRERLDRLAMLCQRNDERRAFLARLRAALKDRAPGSELDGWLSWADDYVEKCDPLASIRGRLGGTIKLYFSGPGADRIQSNGFLEPELMDYGQEKTLPGIPLSSRPNGTHWNPALELELREDDVLPYEWPQDASDAERTFRIPAAVLNRLLGLPPTGSDDGSSSSV